VANGGCGISPIDGLVGVLIKRCCYLFSYSSGGLAVRLLKDDELVSHVSGATPLITGVQQPANWYSNNSPAQPSSLDLHIGDIFLLSSGDFLDVDRRAAQISQGTVRDAELDFPAHRPLQSIDNTLTGASSRRFCVWSAFTAVSR
jgi:hypothetical protein